MTKFYLFMGLLLFSFSEKELQLEDPITLEINDKEFLLDYFQKTTNDLYRSIEGLNQEQLKFKASEEKWSISQCLEHIILTEKMLFEMSKKILEQPANPERKAEVKIADEDLIKGIEDRSQKAKAPAELQPEGKYTDANIAMQDLMEQRQMILDFIEKTPLEDFRNHISDSPFGAVDAYQSFLFIAGHSARHTLQIEEVKNAAGFPME